MVSARLSVVEPGYTASLRGTVSEMETAEEPNQNEFPPIMCGARPWVEVRVFNDLDCKCKSGWTYRRKTALAAALLIPAAGCSGDVPSEGGGSAPDECAELVWRGDGDSLVDTLEVHSLADVDSLPLYTRVEGTLEIEGVDGQVDLGFLRCVTEVTGGIRIMNNPDLVSLAGLDSVTEIGGEHPSYNFVAIIGNGKLRGVEGLGSLEEVGSLSVENNASLESLEGFSSLRSVDVVSIADNDSLSVVGLRALESVGDLLLGGLDCPSDPSAMPAPGGLPGLTTIDGLDSLQDAMIIRILGNPNLASFGGLADADGLFGATFQLNEKLSYDGIVAADFENLYEICGNMNDPVECDCSMFGGP